ncbi:MAG: type II secretion system F family protein [Thermaerobacter sp.]|nr:type II secretion system F family protein [Thermaerobacter sp.]
MEVLLLLEAAAVGLVIGLYAIAPSAHQERLQLQLQEIARHPVQPLQEERTGEGFRNRVLQPFLNSLSTQFARFLPEGQVDVLRARIERAGNPTNPGTIFGSRIILAVIGASFLALGGRAVLFALALGVLGWRLPDFWLAQRIAARQRTFGRALPDVMDLLSVSVEAGLGFDAALSRVSERFPAPISTEFGRTLREIQLGRPRSEALRSFSARIGLPELDSFVSSIVQADELGIGIANVLRVQSDQMRTLRRQKAQEKALKTPIKMLFPLVFFIFPAIFVVLLGPAVLSFAKTFGH